MMYEFLQVSELKDEAKRLLRYRLPLILAILVNFLFVVRLPIARMRAEAALPLQIEEPTTPLQMDEPTTAGSAAPTPRPLPDSCFPCFDPPTAETPAKSAARTPTAAAPAGLLPSVDVPRFAFPGAWRLARERWLESWSALRRLAHAAATNDPQGRLDLRTDTTSAAVAPADLPTECWPLAPPPALAPVSPPLVDAPFPARLTIRNAQENEGAVRFLVNGRVCELQPGEAHEFAEGSSWSVRFHRGEAFGNAERTLVPGHYRFVITDQGWDLTANP